MKATLSILPYRTLQLQLAYLRSRGVFKQDGSHNLLYPYYIWVYTYIYGYIPLLYEHIPLLYMRVYTLIIYDIPQCCHMPLVRSCLLMQSILSEEVGLIGGYLRPFLPQEENKIEGYRLDLIFFEYTIVLLVDYVTTKKLHIYKTKLNLINQFQIPASDQSEVIRNG